MRNLNCTVYFDFETTAGDSVTDDNKKFTLLATVKYTLSAPH